MQTGSGRRASGDPGKFGRGNGAGGFALDSKCSIQARLLLSGGDPAHAGAGKLDLAPDTSQGAAGLGLEPSLETGHARKLRQPEHHVKTVVTCDGIDRVIPWPMLHGMPRESNIANAPNAIAAWRKMRGWSQQELADAAGLSKATISRMEQRGEYTHQSLESVGAALRKETFLLLLPPRSRRLLEAMEILVASSDEERERIIGVMRALTAASAA